MQSGPCYSSPCVSSQRKVNFPLEPFSAPSSCPPHGMRNCHCEFSESTRSHFLEGRDVPKRSGPSALCPSVSVSGWVGGDRFASGIGHIRRMCNEGEVSLIQQMFIEPHTMCQAKIWTYGALLSSGRRRKERGRYMCVGWP